MKLLFSLCLILSMLFSCKKKCELNGRYVVPLYISLSPTPSVIANKDTLKLRISIPFNAFDLRSPSYKISTENKDFSRLYIGFSGAAPTLGVQPIVPELDGFMEVKTIAGRRASSSGLLFEFEKGDTSWMISLNILFLKSFDGVFMVRLFPIEYRDDCLLIQPAQVLVGTQTNHYLIRERLNWPLSPYEDDIFFYVE
jgi:hypothetical protein